MSRQPILTAAALMAKFSAAILDSASISTWVESTYGATAKLTIQAGKDMTDPDGNAASPFVVLTPLPRQLSSAKSAPGTISTPVAVAFVIEAATTSADVDAGSGTVAALQVTHAGIARAEALAALLVDTLDASTAAVKLEFGTLELDEISSWPFINGGFSVTAWPLSFDATTGAVTL